MSAGHDDERGHRSSRSWLIAGLVFAVVATALLVLSDDARWLRLGIVAALWAALLGGFLASHYRRQADRVSESMEEAQAVYELELEREIAARREYELEIEADARQHATESSRAEIDALRGEVATLRETLQKLFGGEVLYERVALTAQSTRMRSFPEERKPLPQVEARKPELPSVVSAPVSAPKRPYDKLAEQRTELIARVLDPDPARREPSRTGGERDGLSWFSAERPKEPTAPRAEPAPPVKRPEPAPVKRPEPARAKPAAKRPEPAPPIRREPPSRREPLPSTPANGSRRPLGSGPPRRVVRNSAEKPAELEPDSGDLSAALSGEVHVDWPPPSEPVNRTLPAGAREIQRSGSPGGRRRKPEPEPERAAELPPLPPSAVLPPLPPEPSRQPSWQQPSWELEPEPARAEPSWEPSWEQPPRAKHARPEPEPVQPEPEPEPAGSHASGRSVAELLAAYGAAESPRRRRRKDEDF